MPKAFAEIPIGATMPERIKPCVVIGKTEPSGMEHGMSLPDKGKLPVLPEYVNDEPYDEENGKDYWARNKAGALDGQNGARCFNLSGALGQWVDSEADFEPYIEAIRRTTGYLTRPLTQDDLVWADTEPEDPAKLTLLAQLGRAIFASGVTGDARICFQGIGDWRYPLPEWDSTPGLCDGNTCYCPLMMIPGRTMEFQLDWVQRCVNGAIEAGLYPVGHITGMMVSQMGVAFSAQDQAIMREANRLARNLGCQTFLVYGLYGVPPDVLLAGLDMPKRRAEDRATWAAITG